MCAEEVKAAAVVCRFCGHRFAEASAEASAPPADALPPSALTATLRRNERLLVWSPCLLNYQEGTLGITSERVLFLHPFDGLLVNRARKGIRAVKVGATISTPEGDSGKGTLLVVLSDERLDFHRLNPSLAANIVDTLTGKAAVAATPSAQAAPTAAARDGGSRSLGDFLMFVLSSVSWRTLLSLRVALLAALVSVIPFALLYFVLDQVGLRGVGAALMWLWIPAVIIVWIAIAADPSQVAVCQHCRKRVKLGASTCHHCGRTVVGGESF